jgi:hypothetical protein
LRQSRGISAPKVQLFFLKKVLIKKPTQCQTELLLQLTTLPTQQLNPVNPPVFTDGTLILSG